MLTSDAWAWMAIIQGGPGKIFTDDSAEQVVTDSAGDVIAGGHLSLPNDANTSSPFVTKRDGDTGKAVWQQLLGPGLAPCFNTCRLPGFGLDAQGDVLAGITEALLANNVATMAAVKLDGGTGAVHWLTTLVGSAGSGRAFEAALDTAGDLVVVGALHTQSPTGAFDSAFSIVKLANADGSILWRRDLEGVDSADADDVTGDFASRVTLDPAGDVFVAGATESATDPQVLQVVKLDGATGADEWPSPVHFPTGAVNPIAATPDGDVVVLVIDVVSVDLVKLSGVDGSILWQVPISDPDTSFGLRVDAAGDVLVSGYSYAGSEYVVHVAKRSGATGDPLWLATIDGPTTGSSVYEEPSDLEIDAQGDVWVAAYLAIPSGSAMTAIELDGVTGTIRSRRYLTGSGVAGDLLTLDRTGALALGPNGRIALAGTVFDPREPTASDFAVVQFSENVTAKTLGIRQGASNLLTLRAQDANLCHRDAG